MLVFPANKQGITGITRSYIAKPLWRWVISEALVEKVYEIAMRHGGNQNKQKTFND